MRVLQAAASVIIPPGPVVAEHAAFDDLVLVIDHTLAVTANLANPALIIVLTGRLTLARHWRVTIPRVTVRACQTIVEVILGAHIQEFAIIGPADDLSLRASINVICTILRGAASGGRTFISGTGVCGVRGPASSEQPALPQVDTTESNTAADLNLDGSMSYIARLSPLSQDVWQNYSTLLNALGMPSPSALKECVHRVHQAPPIKTQGWGINVPMGH